MNFNPVDCLSTVMDLYYPIEPKFKSLTFTPQSWIKLQSYINLVGDYEITGFGRIVDDTIVDIKILKQKVKPANVDCDIDSIVEFMKAIPNDQKGQWILDWHSHVDMGVFMSGTDSENYEAQFKARLKKQFPVMIVNKKSQIWCNNYINSDKLVPIEVSVDKSKKPTVEEITSLYEECYNDVSTLVEVNKPKSNILGYNYNTTTTYNSSDDDYDYDYYWGNWSDRFGTPRYNKKKEKNNDDYCLSCKTYLVDIDEYDRGICSDCWEKMTPTEQMEWSKRI